MNWRSRKLILGATAAALLVLPVVLEWTLAEQDLPTESTAVKHLPHIQPDYGETVIPPNIAPLNFLVKEPGVGYYVRIHGAEGKEILIASRSPSIIIPPRPWRELLDHNRGGRIHFDIYVKDGDGHWSRFDSIDNDVAREEIDSHLVYRLLGPVGGLFRNIEIDQRNLENYDESPILTNESFGGCMNCHTFVNNRPNLFALQIRPGPLKKVEPGLYVVRDGNVVQIKTESKAAPKRSSNVSWHPSGSLLAFSMTTTRQLFPGAGVECRDGYDTESHLAIVNVKTGAVSTSRSIADPDKLENFPTWTPDGKVLYFCSANMLWSKDKYPTIDNFKNIKYDLMRVKYDIEKDEWGQPETILTSAETGLSICEPRISPDGRYLLFCILNYGVFPLFQPKSDLYLMELDSGKYRRLECNSNYSEAWHCWSSNSRWIVFSSKRDNQLMARPYFSYIDQEGRGHKPFVLPQKDPAFYDTWLKTYNVPELVSGPVTIPQEKLLPSILSGAVATDEPPKDKP